MRRHVAHCCIPVLMKVSDTEYTHDIYLLSFTSEESGMEKLVNYKGPFQGKMWFEVL